MAAEVIAGASRRSVADAGDPKALFREFAETIATKCNKRLPPNTAEVRLRRQKSLGSPPSKEREFGARAIEL